jgi:hypothetical protein
MEYTLENGEREHLRELANRQAEYAALNIMQTRKQMWFDLNEGKRDTNPPVVIETWTFDRDFLPEDVFECQSTLGKQIEGRLLQNTRNHELIDDDKVIPDDFEIGWFVHLDEFGVKIDRVSRKDSQGVETAYQHVHPIKDLKEDFHILRPARCTVDKERTLEYKAFLEDLFGDILPIRIRNHGAGVLPFLTHRVITLMGMEAFFLALYDTPDEVHKLMAYLRDNALNAMQWCEAEGLLTLNNRNQDSFGSSYNFTDELPSESYDGGKVRMSDLWGASNSQETVGISPELFNEFCFPYYREVCEPFGLLYYGCCEPAHPFWNDIRRLPHLKKVSISRWCDQNFMADALAGTDIVFSRKPNPNFLSVDPVLDEDAWAKEIRETREATRGVQTEFIIRDVYTVHGNLGNAKRAVEIARTEIGR